MPLSISRPSKQISKEPEAPEGTNSMAMALQPELSGQKGELQAAIASSLSVPGIRHREAEELLRGGVESILGAVLPIKQETPEMG